MKDRKLTAPEGYDMSRQRMVALFAAQLDDRSQKLKENLAGLTIEQLQWQPHPGVNTIGMLLAHLAVSEVYWLNVAPAEMRLEPEGDNLILNTIGIRMDDDGLPLASDARHSATLRGKSLTDYFGMLDKARRASHATMQKWNDADLDTAYKLRDFTVTRAWTVYHILEHTAGHYGQMLLLKHLMGDAGVLKVSDPA
ncbi:MAG: DinB family protein [Candidatus Zixiibacteriota bacterium]